MSEYDVKRGGVQRVHSDGPSLCWIWTKVLRGRVWVIHLSLGPPLWLKPDVRVKRYSGITERRVGWGLVAVQVASKPARTGAP